MEMTGLNDWFNDLRDKAYGTDIYGYVRYVDEMVANVLQTIIKGGYDELYFKALLLKVANLLIAKYQYEQRHDLLISFPYFLVIDPANGCPLHCPGCLHNRTFKEKIGPDWQAGFLSEKIFGTFIKNFGAYASHLQLFNWGEPLLNKLTPLFISQAKSYLLHTSLSSNLSVKFDAEALVMSGLDHMILSIDGSNRDSYEQYRRGGDYDLVIENVRRVVEAKKKCNLSTPWLTWQFLLFEHNKHEVEAVKKMACELGVNEVNFARPYDVIWDSDLQIARDVKEETFIVPEPEADRRLLKRKYQVHFWNS